MTIYVDLLAAALAGERGATTTPDGLSAAAATCRARMLDDRRNSGRSVERQLASEIEYDRCLIHFCTAMGIDASPDGFAQPAQERARLERALVALGASFTGDDPGHGLGSG
jgi:hypothetical protein